MTFDGQRYDFQVVGEFVAARSTEDDLEVQLRFGPIGVNRRLSVTTGAAARIANTRVTVILDREPPVWVNGKPVDLDSGAMDLGEGAGVVKAGRGYEIRWPDQSTLSIEVYRTSVSAYFTPAGSRSGKLAGLFGNFDGDRTNDMVTSTGERIQRPFRFEDIYGKFGPPWRVTDEDSLFDYGPGETTATFSDLDYPTGAAGIAQLSVRERREATETCKQAGVTDAAVIEDCIVDVGFTGESEFAESAVAVQTRVGAVLQQHLSWFGGVSLDAASTATASFPFEVHVRGAATKDYIVVIASVGTEAGTSPRRKALRGGEQIIKIDLPVEPGNYELRYETRRPPHAIRHRQPLTVTLPSARIVAPEMAKAGSRLAMSCLGDCSPNANLAVVPVGTPDQDQGNHFAFMSGGPDVSIKLPEQPGAYEIRYVTRFGQRKVFARKPLTIQ